MKDIFPTFVAMNKIVTLVLIFTTLAGYAQRGFTDSIHLVEKISVTAVKQGSNLRQEPIASTTLTSIEVERNNISSMKDVRNIAPNFYIPDYGSRITSSIYVRGLGARIDNPVVGLNIDNVPYLNKNAFDTDVMDISRFEVLRGPQSTLYGRNTMGGVVNIYTLSPMEFEGVKIGAEYSSGNTYRLRGAVYNRLSDRVAIAAGLYHSSTDGLFVNEYTGEECDTATEFGGRVRLVYKPSTSITIDNALSISVLDQGGYPYYSLENEAVNYNDESGYKRTMVSNGLSASRRFANSTLTSITGYQYLDDEMRLDNDFTAEDIFTLTQAITEHSITQDILFKGDKKEGYNHLCGVFAFYKNQRMSAPVTFKEAGIEKLIVNNIIEKYNDMGIDIEDCIWDSDNFLIETDLTTNTFGAALYHESSYVKNRWTLKAGLRLDYEMAKIDYKSTTDTGCTYIYKNNDSQYKPAKINLDDNTSLDFFELLPKISASYKIDHTNSIYASVSKGYKSGGFNTQMFSDVVQQNIMYELASIKMAYTTDEIITYKPEYSWNYEIGGHFTNNKRNITTDIALFYINCHDQQLTILPDGMVTGRMMTNAGKSRSYGVEISTKANFGRFSCNGSYGYTNAKFTNYTDSAYDENKNRIEVDYAGNYIPYAPQNTLYAAISYTQPIRTKLIEDIRFEVNTNGVGKIYWEESNSISQPFYALMGAEIRITNKDYSLSLWNRNITNKEYYTFYFESIKNKFMQRGKSSTFGITLNITIN